MNTGYVAAPIKEVSQRGKHAGGADKMKVFGFFDGVEFSYIAALTEQEARKHYDIPQEASGFLDVTEITGDALDIKCITPIGGGADRLSMRDVLEQRAEFPCYLASTVPGMGWPKEDPPERPPEGDEWEEPLIRPQTPPKRLHVQGPKEETGRPPMGPPPRDCVSCGEPIFTTQERVIFDGGRHVCMECAAIAMPPIHEDEEIE